MLRTALKDDAVRSSLSEEGYFTAVVFQKDFEKSAIELPTESRKRFLSLSAEILSLGRHFLQQVEEPRPPVQLSLAGASGVERSRTWGSRLRSPLNGDKKVMVYPGSLQARAVMQTGSDESRFKLYVTANSSTPRQIATLERLLKARAELAQLVGDTSFAHMTLSDKMARTPGSSLFLSFSPED